MTEDKEKSKPVFSIHVGSIQASVWERRKEDNIMHSIKFDKSYKEDDVWKTTNYLNVRDLQDVKLALDKCHEWIKIGSKENNIPTPTDKPVVKEEVVSE